MIELNQLPHQTTTITNRHGLNVFVRFNGEVNGKPLALVAHGLSDAHDSAALRAMTSALIETGHNVLVWDATHSSGRSGGNLRQATVTAAFEDLTDVVHWAAREPWFSGAFILAGHSLGGAAALMFASAEPSLVSRLILISPLVAGKLAAKRLNIVVRWLWRLSGRLPQPGNKRSFLGYNLFRDGMNYDGRTLASALDIPTVVLVGAADRVTPDSDARQLFNEIPSDLRHLVIIPHADHVFSATLADLEAAIKTAVWLV